MDDNNLNVPNSDNICPERANKTRKLARILLSDKLGISLRKTNNILDLNIKNYTISDIVKLAMKVGHKPKIVFEKI